MANFGVDSSFTPVGVVEEPIRREARSTARTGYLVFANSAGFEVAIPEIVVERMTVLGELASPREWYGLLVGRLYEDAEGRHVIILGVVPDPEADARNGSVRTSFDSELRTRMTAQSLYPDGMPVGWAHGHIRYGARYSSTDFRNQATWTQPHSIGIVVDPFSEPKLGVYRGPEGEVLKRVLPPPAAPATVTSKAEGRPWLRRQVHLIVGFVRRTRPFLSSIAAVLILVAAAMLWGHTARLDEQNARLERRVTDLERARGEAAIPSAIPAFQHEDEVGQAALVEAADAWPICIKP